MGRVWQFLQHSRGVTANGRPPIYARKTASQPEPGRFLWEVGASHPSPPNPSRTLAPSGKARPRPPSFAESRLQTSDIGSPGHPHQPTFLNSERSVSRRYLSAQHVFHHDCRKLNTERVLIRYPNSANNERRTRVGAANFRRCGRAKDDLSYRKTPVVPLPGSKYAAANLP